MGGVTSCSSSDDKDVDVTSVTVAGSDTVKIGNSEQYTATVLPSDATDKTVNWTLSPNNSDIAEIQNVAGSSASILLTGKKAGQVTIIATAGGVSSISKTVTISEDGASAGTGIYADFYNYPTGKQNASGTLEVVNQLTTSQVLIFDGTVEAANYIGTINGNSSIKVKLDADKFHTIVGILKSDYDEKEDLALCGQSSTLTYYSSTMAYKVSVSPDSLAGAGKWIFNNNTNYWASIEAVDNSKTYAVIQPKALRVTVPIELNTSYDYKIVYKKELKYQDTVLAITDSTLQSQNDTVQVSESTTTTFTTDINGIGTGNLGDLAPSVLFINNSGKSVRIYNGQVQLSNITNKTAEDYVVISGATAMVTGLTSGSSSAGITVRSVSWSGPIACTESVTMDKGKVYVIKIEDDKNYGVTGSPSTSPIKWTVTEKEAKDYYDE